MTDRISAQELDDVLAAHGVCHGSNCGWRPVHCEAHAEEVIPWPCLDYRLARDLKAALKVVEKARESRMWTASYIVAKDRTIGTATYEEDMNVRLNQMADSAIELADAIRAYDTEETQ